MFVSAVHRVEQALTGPLLHPVSFIKEEWQAEIRPNSSLTLYCKEESEDELVLVMNSPDEYFMIDKVGHKIVKKNVPDTTSSPSSTTEAGTSSTSPRTSTPSSTVPNVVVTESTSGLPFGGSSTTSANPMSLTTVDLLTYFMGPWPTTTTTTSTTVSTTTVSTPTTTETTTVVPPSETWFEKMSRYLRKVRSFSDFLATSWGMLTIYDIVLGLIVLIHSGLIGFLLYVSGRMVGLPPRVAKLIVPRFLTRLFGRKKEVNAEDMSPSAPMDTELTEVVVKTPKGSRRVSYAEYADYSDGESQPIQTRRSPSVKQITRKRPAPPVPSAPAMVPSTSTGTVRGRKTIRRVYLESNLPLYLADSDLSD